MEAQPVRHGTQVQKWSRPWCPDELLARAATGDVEAFMEFYDATCTAAHRLELCRLEDPVAAEDATVARYLSAWRSAASHATSGLSPAAWLLANPPTISRVRA